MIRVMRRFLRTYLDVPDLAIQASIRFLQLLLILVLTRPLRSSSAATRRGVSRLT